MYCRSFDREGLGKISEKTFVELLKTKDDIANEDIQEMLEEYYRYLNYIGFMIFFPNFQFIPD